MRLTQIKLAGFKSFTDPTTLHLPGKLVAVVGPNGCGKSNVIDAVRWVLGEASAKQLRGESMQDVIFNGAAGRRPAPRASVELVFDNSDHSLQGAWGRYAEVSVKRRLTRQGESSYFINQQPVRRRDITDLFLGTGVGARGYAVIEQGMISRIIEARPEELRAYIEEAAGISKYKERRRETALRLKDAREHLLRLTDLQNELSRQVEKLNVQAAKAGQYRSLNDRLQQQLNQQDYLHRQNALSQADTAAAQHAAAQRQQQDLDSESGSLNGQIHSLREQEYAAQQQCDTLNAQLAQIRVERARVEEQIRADAESRQRSERERAAAREQIALLQQQHADVLAQAAAVADQITARQTLLAELAVEVAVHEEQLPELEERLQQSEHIRNSQQEQLNRLKQDAALKHQQQQHNQTHLADLTLRRERLQQELDSLYLPDETEQHTAEQEAASLQQQYDLLEQQSDTHRQHSGSLKTRLQQTEQQYRRLHTDHLNAQSRQQALAELLQQSTQQDAWADTPFADSPALWQHIQIAPAWQHAAAAVLGQRLHARLLPEHTPAADLPQHDAAWINVSALPDAQAQPEQALLNQIQAGKPFQAALTHWLDGILCAPDLTCALAEQSSLKAHQQWLTPEGHLIDRHGAVLFAAHAADQTVRHKARHDSLTAELESIAPQLADAEEAYTQARQAAEQADTHTQTLHQHQQHTARQLQAARQRANELTARGNQSQIRRSHLLEQIRHIDEEREIAAIRHETLSADSDTLAQAAAELEHRCTEHNSSLHNQRQQLKHAQLALLEANRRYGAAELEQHKQQQHTDNLQQQAAQLTAQQQQWQQRISTDSDDNQHSHISQELHTKLETAAHQADTLHEQLLHAQEQLHAIQEQGRTAYARLQQTAAALPQIQAAVQTALLQQQQSLLQAQHHHDRLIERGADPDTLAAQTAHSSLKQLETDIAATQEHINALGAVNLAALEELAEAQQRDDYYRNQSQDVQAAIALLEEAVAQIDTETQARFQATFNAANQKMQELFPLLFGGGKAALHLTGDDWLNAGITIMAQPTGKKNTTIHLLSGGEKALTAMSLVFALFSLNPAPFCLLDEVDAPLDDANTARFCRLVKQMSVHTQFLYISHNRITMEMAQQLIGVTMQEKGVSRIVDVDLRQALDMAEAA